MSKRTTPTTERANAAATAILQLIAAEGADLPAGELHCRIFSLLLEHFDAITRENETDYRALLAARGRR